MPQKIVYYCDACPKDEEVMVDVDERVVLKHGRKMDAAGSMENDNETLWLCHRCSLDALCRLLETDISHSSHSDLSKWVKRRKG